MPEVQPIQPPKLASIKPPAKVSAPKPPAPSKDYDVSNDASGPTFPRKTSQSNLDRTGTRISFVSVDLSTNRVAFETKEGPPVRGYITTDIDPGNYVLKVDRNTKTWRFSKGTVKSGLRFAVHLIGVNDPFDLKFDDDLPLLVMGEHGAPQVDPLPGAVQ